MTLATVVSRYAEVVRLDLGVADDWIQLVRLYLEPGKLAEARCAVDALAAAAHNERDRQQALSERADVLQAQGDLVGAGRAAEECLRSSRALRAQYPDDIDIFYRDARALLVFGEVARRQNDLAAAENAYQEEVTLMRKRVASAEGTDTDRGALSGDLLHLADTLISARRPALLRAVAAKEIVATATRLSQAEPGNARLESDRANG